MRFSVYFWGAPGDTQDIVARSIFEKFGGKFIGAGTMLVGIAAGERDVEYEIPDHCLEDIKKEFKENAFDFRFEPIS